MSAIAQRRTAAAAAIMMLFAVLQLVLFAVNPTPAGAAHVDPINLQGAANVTCAELAADYGFDGVNEAKSDPPAEETLLIPGGSVTISNLTSSSFDWVSSVRLDAVLVKSGNDESNLYIYSPDSFGDTGLTTQGGADISHISFCYDNSPTTSTTGSTFPDPTDPVCPTIDGDGVVARVLNQGGYIYANRTADDADTGPFSISLTAGVYDVYLTSWDNHTGRAPDPSQTQERYYVNGWFEGSLVWTSSTIDDLPDDQDLLTQLVDVAVSIPELDQVGAMHAAYPNDIGNSHQPVCVVFVPHDQPEPTPVSVVVSGTCAVLQDGNVARVSVDSIDPDGDVVVTIGGVSIAEGASADLALDTDLAVTASSPSGDFAPTTNVSSLNISSEGCDEPTTTTTQPRTRPTTPEVLSALGDLVWFDENRNGQQDDPTVEFPINGATVTLLSSNGTVLAQQVTGLDGLYLFDELDAGNYRVEVCVEGAEYTTTNAAGVAMGANSDVWPLADKGGCARTALINLPEGVTDLTWDAGLVIEVRGIQVEPTTTTAPTTTTIEPVTVGTLPFTGFEVENVAILGITVLALGSALLLLIGRRDGEADGDVISGWSNE